MVRSDLRWTKFRDSDIEVLLPRSLQKLFLSMAPAREGMGQQTVHRHCVGAQGRRKACSCRLAALALLQVRFTAGPVLESVDEDATVRSIPQPRTGGMSQRCSRILNALEIDIAVSPKPAEEMAREERGRRRGQCRMVHGNSK